MKMIQDRPKAELHAPEEHSSHRVRQRRVPLLILTLLLFFVIIAGGLIASQRISFLPHENAAQPPHHWLSVHLIGTGRSNFAAIGAQVTVTAGGHLWNALVEPRSENTSQSTPPLTFNLGSSTHIDLVEIRWPDERVERLSMVPIDTSFVRREGDMSQ